MALIELTELIPTYCTYKDIHIWVSISNRIKKSLVTEKEILNDLTEIDIKLNKANNTPGHIILHYFLNENWSPEIEHIRNSCHGVLLYRHYRKSQYCGKGSVSDINVFLDSGKPAALLYRTKYSHELKLYDFKLIPIDKPKNFIKWAEVDFHNTRGVSTYLKYFEDRIKEGNMKEQEEIYNSLSGEEDMHDVVNFDADTIMGVYTAHLSKKDNKEPWWQQDIDD